MGIESRDLAFGIAPPRYRLPENTRLGPVRLQVGHLERSLEFYQLVLGLRPLTSGLDQASLAAWGDDRPLVHLEERRGARPAPPYGVIGLYHFAILLPDRPALGRFLAHVGNVWGRVGTADHAVSESVYLTDPDGLGIEVYADRSRSSWRTGPGRQLYMTTAPLDVRNVIAAGEEKPWTGMPAGTTMGHVHLHVGDLEQASSFYHSGLGLDKIVWQYPGALFLAAGGYHHHLGTNTWASGPPAAEDQARLLWWDVMLPDRDEAAAAARSLAEVAVVEIDPDQAWVAADPWGTRLRLVAGG